VKNYKAYMDRVTVSDTLHARLMALEESKMQTPSPWKKYGSLAAALVLVVGLAGWFGLGMREDGTGGGTTGTTDIGPVNSSNTVMEVAPEPSIAPGPSPVPAPIPSGALNTGMETVGGYEVRGDGVVQYFMLPAIFYGEVESEARIDWAPPVGVSRREMDTEEILRLWKYGEQVLSAHLDWEGYEITAHAMVNRDGSLWCLWLYGTASDTEHFTLTVMPGGMPPTCIFYPESISNDLWGVEVFADGHDGETDISRRIRFMKDDIGYSFEIVGEANGKLYERVSRLARWIIIEGLDLSAFGIGEEESVSGAVSTVNPSGDGASTPAYDPSASRAPAAFPTPTPAPTIMP